MWKYIKYCLKTENCCLETLTKHPLNYFANTDKFIHTFLKSVLCHFCLEFRVDSIASHGYLVKWKEFKGDYRLDWVRLQIYKFVTQTDNDRWRILRLVVDSIGILLEEWVKCLMGFSKKKVFDGLSVWLTQLPHVGVWWSGKHLGVIKFL